MQSANIKAVFKLTKTSQKLVLVNDLYFLRIIQKNIYLHIFFKYAHFQGFTINNER